MRTLTYLAVLRFVALHRHVKWQLSVVIGAILRLTGLRRMPWSEKEQARTAPKVRWGETTESPTKFKAKTAASVKGTEPATAPPHRPMVDARLVYALLLVIVLRSTAVKSAMKVVLVDVPSRVVPQQMLDCASRLLAVGVAGAAGRTRKRDVVKGLLGLGGSETLRGRLKELGCRPM